MNKYFAKKVNDPDHGKFDSKDEFARFKMLLLLERVGEVTNLRRQVVYQLAPAVVIKGRKRPPLRYIADFVYAEVDKEVVEDVKGGPITEGFRIKRHLMKSVHGIEIRETRM